MRAASASSAAMTASSAAHSSAAAPATSSTLCGLSGVNTGDLLEGSLVGFLDVFDDGGYRVHSCVEV
jgi:hypothetical protein